MDGPFLVGLERFAFIYDFTQNIDDTTEGAFAYRHCDWLQCVFSDHASGHAVGGAHGYASDAVVAKHLLHFADNSECVSSRIDAGDFKGVVNLRQVSTGEFHVNDRSDYLHHLTLGLF